MHQMLREGRPNEALALLADDAKLAWVKDSHSGGYPVHLAAFKVSSAALQGLRHWGKEEYPQTGLCCGAACSAGCTCAAPARKSTHLC